MALSEEQGDSPLRIETRYLPMDCPNCGRHRLEYDGVHVVCEKCGSTNWEYDGSDIPKLRAFEKRATPILDYVAHMGRDGWYYHPQEGWFCPFACHIVMTEGAEKTRILLDRTETPTHRPQCGIVLARQWGEESKR